MNVGSSSGGCFSGFWTTTVRAFWYSSFLIPIQRVPQINIVESTKRSCTNLFWVLLTLFDNGKWLVLSNIDLFTPVMQFTPWSRSCILLGNIFSIVSPSPFASLHTAFTLYTWCGSCMTLFELEWSFAIVKTKLSVIRETKKICIKQKMQTKPAIRLEHY